MIFLFLDPTERWGHAFCKTCQDKAVVIGGQSKHQMCSDSLWLLDLSKPFCIDRKIFYSVI